MKSAGPASSRELRSCSSNSTVTEIDAVEEGVQLEQVLEGDPIGDQINDALHTKDTKTRTNQAGR